MFGGSFAKHNSPAPKAAVRNISIPPIISADGSVLAPRSGPPQVRRACCHIFSARSEAAESAWPRHIAASASRRPSMSASARGVQEAGGTTLAPRLGLAALGAHRSPAARPHRV